jgi:phosphatidylserine/phosphatidylglycerophosphate/cardiolipin synthase-like enzyme
MALAPHKLDKAKRVEGIGSLKILDDVKIGIRRLKGLKLHGKILLADGQAAIIGSPNLTPGTFDSRREAAIELSDDHVVKRLEEIVHYDWKHAHPIDLSDEGLMADLEDPDEGRRLGVHPQ